MPKKLKLSDLKVQSFVTSLENDEKKKVQGGATLPISNCAEDTCLECETNYSCDCPTNYTCYTNCGTCGSCAPCSGTCNTDCGLTTCKSIYSQVDCQYC